MSKETYRDTAVFADMSIEAQLFEVVRRVCLIERGTGLPLPESEKIAEWQVPGDPQVGLRNVCLDRALGQAGFRVKYGTLIAGDENSAFSIRIDREPYGHGLGSLNSDHEDDFKDDPIVSEVLDMFKAFVKEHPKNHYETCVRPFQKQRLAQRAAIAQERKEQIRLRTDESRGFRVVDRRKTA